MNHRQRIRFLRRYAGRRKPCAGRRATQPKRRIRIRASTITTARAKRESRCCFDNHFDAYEGQIVIMTGPSGSGKTTLLTLLGTLRTVQEGSLQVLGRELRWRRRGELVDVRRDIGFIFQAHNLFDSLTALQNVRMAMELFQLSGARDSTSGPRRLLDAAGPGRPAATTSPIGSPAGRSSASPSPAASSTGRKSSWPTSRPPPSTRNRAATS